MTAPVAAPASSKLADAERQRSKDIVDLLVLRAQRKTELVYGVVRIGFALAILVRFVCLNDLAGTDAAYDDRARSLVEVPALLGAAAASLPIMWLALREQLSPWLLDLSVLIDVAATCTALLSNVLAPWPGYPGLLNTPDVAILPVLCLAAGLRMSVRATLLGSAATALGFAGLHQVDDARNAARAGFAPTTSDLYFIYLAAATVLGVLLARRARALAEASARQALRAEVARDGLTQVLQDRHDFGSLLTSARMNADMLRRALDGPGGAPVRELVSALQGGLSDLAATLAASRDRTYAELAASASVEHADPGAVLRGLERSLALRFPHVRFRPDAALASAPRVAIVGGARGLERVLLNLLVNAAEGDGRAGATEVEVAVARRGGWVELSISDDGPGFTDALLVQRAERFASTKPHGSGLGLVLVESVVQASGGKLLLENRAPGACVTLALRAARVL